MDMIWKLFCLLGLIWLTHACVYCDVRSVDGSGNNKINSDWGRAGAPFKRLVPATYDDYVGSPRTKSTTGGDLPSAREVSRSVLAEATSDDLSESISVLTMTYGQFTDHDITATPKDEQLEALDCCGNDKLHQDCFPIPVDQDDPDFTDCMNLQRSTPYATLVGGKREQTNEITAFIDGSNVYGSDPGLAAELRTFNGGKLKTRDGGNLLPAQNIYPDTCKNPANPELPCFLAGDKRVNEQMSLTALHILWVKEHNRLATRIYEFKKNQDSPFSEAVLDEQAYQEARGIVIAEMQVILYREWLPMILQDSDIEKYNLDISQDSVYNPLKDPTVLNEFATAAFRFGHLLVPSGISMMDQSYAIQGEEMNLADTFFDPAVIYSPNAPTCLLRGVIGCPAKIRNMAMDDSIHKHLFANVEAARDLGAVNIQRGRDHGIAPYNDYRLVCGLERAYSFDDLVEIPAATREILKSIYAHVDDIDLFIGGAAESSTPGRDASVGPTFSCIIAAQFGALRSGDRYFFSHIDGQYATEEIESLRKVSLAAIICENMNICTIPEDVFSLNSPMMDCESLYKLNPTH